MGCFVRWAVGGGVLDWVVGWLSLGVLGIFGEGFWVRVEGLHISGSFAGWYRMLIFYVVGEGLAVFGGI